MKAYLKLDPSRIGSVLEVFCLPSGQKRISVQFDENDVTFSTVEANIEEFEVMVEA